MSDDAIKPIPRWLLGSFLVYFAAILPGMLWGLWQLITKNTFSLPVVIPAEIMAMKPSTLDRANYVSAHRQTVLVLSQGELFLAVMLAGGIGSYIHGVNSFVTYVGNRSFRSSWAPWYLLRPFMGVGMAVIFYVVIRGGVLVMSGGVSQVDPYAMMTVAALAGMFSKQASDKLAEVFDTLFRSRADDERRDKLEKPPVKITALDPDKVTAGSADTTFTVRGTGFVEGAVARVAGTDVSTTFKSATELTIQVPAANLATAGEIEIEIANPGQDGGSGKVKLIVEAAPAPAGDGGAGGAGQDAGVQITKVVGDNGDGSLNVISEARVTITPGVTDTAGSSGTTTGESSGTTDAGTTSGDASTTGSDTSTTVSETSDPTSTTGGGMTSETSGTTSEGAATGGSSDTTNITAESLAGSTAGTGDGTSEAADETTPKL